MPADDANLETAFTIGEYANVEVNDNNYTTQGAADEYGIAQFKDKNDNNTDIISATCILKSDLAPSSSIVKLQIYNRNTPAWEDLATNNATAADTEFTLAGIQSANLANYYDGSYWVSFRVWQEAA